MATLRYIMLLAALVGMGVGIVEVQRVSSKHNDHLKAGKRGVTFKIARGQQLAIKINNLGRYGVVAVHKDTDRTTNEMDSVVVKGWAVVFDDLAKKNTLRSVREVKHITPMPVDAISLHADRLGIDGRFAGQYNAAIHITVPETSKISLMINGEPVKTGASGQDILVRGHEVVEGQFRGSEPMTLANAMLGAVFKGDVGPLDPDVLYVPQRSDGVVSVPWTKLTELVVHGSLPDYSAVSNAKGDNWAFVDISVDESGIVAKALPKSFGNVGLATVVAQSLTQWRFHPFVYQNKPTRIMSTVPVRLVDGRILLTSQ